MKVVSGFQIVEQTVITSLSAPLPPPQESSDVHLEEDGMGKCLMFMTKNECKKWTWSNLNN